MPSRHDRIAARSARVLQRLHGELDGTGKSSAAAVTLIDPTGKLFPLAAIIGSLTIDETGGEPGDGMQEWSGRGEQLEVKLVACELPVTDAWKVEVAKYPGRTFAVERVEHPAGMLMLRLGFEGTERIQRRGYE